MAEDWFITLAELENVSAAARQLHLTQPTLSRMLGRLERDVGVELFDRHAKRLRLNTYGQIYLGHLRRAVAEIDAARHEIADRSGPVEGAIDLGFLHSFGVWLVPTLIGEFRRQTSSRVSFTLTQDAAATILDRVVTGPADLAIVSPRPRSNDVGWAPILRQQLALAVPADHPLAVRDEVSMTEAREEFFVAMAPGFGMRRILEELCAEADFRPRITFEATELGTVAGFVAAGLGVAVIPVEDNPQLPPGLTLVPLVGDRSSRDVGLIWHRDRAMTPVARRFRDYVTEWAAERTQPQSSSNV
jgi:DNA-binding transcriptional LysR family regulator